MELPNSIKIYRDNKAMEQITLLVNKFPFIWKFSGFVQMLLKW